MEFPSSSAATLRASSSPTASTVSPNCRRRSGYGVNSTSERLQAEVRIWSELDLRAADTGDSNAMAMHEVEFINLFVHRLRFGDKDPSGGDGAGDGPQVHIAIVTDHGAKLIQLFLWPYGQHDIAHFQRSFGMCHGHAAIVENAGNHHSGLVCHRDFFERYAFQIRVAHHQ